MGTIHSLHFSLSLIKKILNSNFPKYFYFSIMEFCIEVPKPMENDNSYF